MIPQNAFSLHIFPSTRLTTRHLEWYLILVLLHMQNGGDRQLRITLSEPHSSQRRTLCYHLHDWYCSYTYSFTGGITLNKKPNKSVVIPHKLQTHTKWM